MTISMTFGMIVVYEMSGHVRTSMSSDPKLWKPRPEMSRKLEKLKLAEKKVEKSENFGKVGKIVCVFFPPRKIDIPIACNDWLRWFLQVMGEKAEGLGLVAFETLPWACRFNVWGKTATVLGTKETRPKPRGVLPNKNTRQWFFC